MPVQFSTLPVTLGVTGHRDVQDTEQLLTLLESEISAIQARYPHSPVMALSSLAEGADLRSSMARGHAVSSKVIMQRGALMPMDAAAR